MRIALVSEAPHVDLGALSRIAAAVTVQLARDFCPAWGLAPVAVTALSSVPSMPTPADDWAVLRVTDESAGEGLAGVHDTDVLGRPTGIVSVGAIFAAGGGLYRGPCSVSAIVSHEALEMVADAWCTYWADGPPVEKVGEWSYALEVCDPVGDVVYQIDGIDVSDFVLPSWFGGGGAPYDHLLYVDRPFGLAAGGYAIVRQVGPEGVRASRLGHRASWRVPTRGARRGA